jgi:hypothetical protein
VLLAAGTYVLSHILKHARLQRHIHVDGPGDPAQLTLAHIQDPVHLGRGLAAKLGALPCGACNLFHSGFDLCKSEVVYIGILLLVVAILGEGKAVERFVV